MIGGRPYNHNKPWTKDHMRIVAAMAPTDENAKKLAKILGRTEHAIQYMWCKLYMRITDLKDLAANDTKTGQYKMILEVKREFNITLLY